MKKKKAQELLQKTLSTLSNNKIIVNVCLGLSMHDWFDFIPSKQILSDTSTVPYCIGVYHKVDVFIDPQIRWADLRVLSIDGEILLDLSFHEIKPSDLL